MVTCVIPWMAAVSSALATTGGPVQLVAAGPGFVRVLYQRDVPLPASAPFPADALHRYVEAAVVGVPLNGPVELEILEAHIGAHLPEAELPEAELPEDLRLDAPACLGAPAMLRHQRVVRLRFTPARGPDGGVLIYDRVLVEIRFAGAEGTTASEDGFEASYRATVLNYEQARHWRAGRQPARRASQAGVLPAAGMIRLTVRSSGMYRVTGTDLEEAGVDLRQIDPARARVLYGGGLTLGLARRVSPGITLSVLPAVVEDGGDGRFDEDDYVLFHADGPERWDYVSRSGYVWRSNLYTKDNVYWLDLAAAHDAPRAAQHSVAPSGKATKVVTQYRERIHEEDDRLILRQLTGINSGYDWYWEAFTGNARNFTIGINDPVADLPVHIRVRLWGWSGESHFFDVLWNERNLGRSRFAGSEPHVIALNAPGGAQDGLNQLGLFHRDSNATRLDWFEIEYIRRLTVSGGELVFDWPRAEDGGAPVDSSSTAEFQVTGVAADGGRPRIFEISTGMQELVGFEYDTAAGTVRFEHAWNGSGPPPRYVVVQASRWKRPQGIVRDPHERLRDPANAAEYVIITHADFRSAAQRLGDWRAVDDRFGPPLQSKVVDVQDIYDEFSGGLLDPMAIRAFINYAVDNWASAPIYVTLIGDATYDYKNNSGVSHTNWIPPYQDGQSMYDEWYVRIEGEDSVPDLAIARLPVQTLAEADAVVDKIIAYDQAPEPGVWQGEVLIVADDVSNPQSPDQFESFFLFDAEMIARRGMPEDLDITKLYVGTYQLEGRTKPRARDEFIRQFNAGALILTYIGHGNPEVLAHEQIFLVSRDIGSIDNGGRLPFVYTAASQVGVFDDPARESMPEAMMKMPDGGVIGFISATRVGFHNSNMVLARQFHTQMYRSGRRHVALGLALMEAKQIVDISSEFRVNIQRYSLLGDAAQRLARPRLSVALDMPDTLEALMEVEVEGVILNADGAPRTDYTGQALLRVFDSAASSEVEGLPYQQVGASIFRGRVPVAGGRFQTRFRVPKDITYRAVEGRASAYVTGAETAFGSVSGLRLEGTAQNVEADDTGPLVRLAFDGNDGFRGGDFVSARPVLTAFLADPNGINITGETGHQIELRVDDVVTTVTQFYTSIDDHQQGRLEYPMGELEPGEHTIRLKAWDTFNNSAVAEATFVVAEAADAGLAGVLFHPNPLRDGSGHFTYTLTTPATRVTIHVFALSGRRLAEIEGDVALGYNQVAWAPADLANGTYLYQLEAQLDSGERVDDNGWIQVAR